MKNNNITGFGILAAILAAIFLCGYINSYKIVQAKNQMLTELHQQNEELRTELAELAEKERTIVQNVCVVTDGVADDQIYAFTAEGWLQYLMELPGNCTVSSMDMNLFDYALTEDIQWPEELTAYLDSDNEMLGSCTTTSISDKYNTVFFGRNDGFLLGYKQNPEWQSVNYVSICVICDKDAEDLIKFDIDGVSCAKKVYCDDYCDGVGRELLVFTRDGKLYAVNEAMEIYEVSCRTS